MSRQPANPFPVGKIDGEIWADRKEIYPILRRSLEVGFGASEPLMIMIRGEYGSGKSHALRHIEYQMTHGWDKMSGFPVYIETPGESLTEFFNNFFFSIKMENIVHSMRELYAIVLRSKTDQIQKEMSAEAIVSSLDPRQLSSDLKQMLIDLFKATGFSLRGSNISDHWEYLATALSLLPRGGIREFTAAKWLTFQRLYQRDRDILGIPVDNKSSPAHVAATMVAITRLIARAHNYPKILLLIDELEEVRGSDEVEDIAQCLRHLVDSGLPELIIVLGSSVSAEDIFGQVQQALYRRIHMTMFLKPLNPSDVVQLVDKYMARSSEAKESWLSEDAATVFCDEAQGRMSDLLQILNRAYFMSVQKGWKKIDSVGRAKEILLDISKFGFPYAFVETETETSATLAPETQTDQSAPEKME